MRTPFLLVGAAWFVMMAGSNLATPLYAVYEREFGFSNAVLTVVFATYALVLAPSLLVFGQLSDRIGRRRVMAAGFLTATLGLVAFAAASALGWLFAARAIQGLAVGMISGAAAAALVELDPVPAEDRAALVSSLAQAVHPGLRERGVQVGAGRAGRARALQRVARAALLHEELLAVDDVAAAVRHAAAAEGHHGADRAGAQRRPPD